VNDDDDDAVMNDVGSVLFRVRCGVWHISTGRELISDAPRPKDGLEEQKGCECGELCACNPRLGPDDQPQRRMSRNEIGCLRQVRPKILVCSID